MKVPTVGESITEVTVASWSKSNGDFVEMDDIICELESDKATFEVAAEVSGQLAIKAQEGDTVEIGGVLCEIDENASGAAKPMEQKEETIMSESKPTGEILEMKVPAVGESITEVTLSVWQKTDGDFVELDENIAEIESDKATFDLPAEGQGILRIVAQEGDTLEIGALICKIEIMDGEPVQADSIPAKSAGSAQLETRNSKLETLNCSLLFLQLWLWRHSWHC